MQTPTAPLAPASAERPAPSAPGRWVGALTAAADPDWLLFLAVLLLPAGLCLAVGQPRRASFFFGTAVYLACLKWLGWLVLGRWSAVRPRYALFPAELFAGLAFACAWFYLRNLVAKAWPASYGLGELAVLAPALAVLHAAAALRSGLNTWRAGGVSPLLKKQGADAPRSLVVTPLPADVYLPFAATLAIALWRVADSLNPQTVDPIFHAFAARVWGEVGLTRPHPFLGYVLTYPSGYGATNVVTTALAPLSVAQAVNLQHVLWLVAFLFLAVGAVVSLAGRRLWLLWLMPLLFLATVPLYSLYPDNCYSGAPRQTAVPLLAAAALLPVLTAARGRTALWLGGAAAALLGAIAAAMNPACVPFAGFALLVGLVILAARAGRAALAFPVLLALAAALVLACDPYYVPQLTQRLAPPTPTALPPAEASAPSAPPEPEVPAAPAAPTFSIGEVFALAPNQTVTGAGGAAEIAAWPARGPYAALPALALGAACAAAGLVVLRRRAKLPTGAVPLAWLAAGCVAVWLVSKPAFLALGAATAGASGQAQLLAPYIGFLLLRWELLLLFAASGAAGSALFLLAEGLPLGARLFARLAGGVTLAALAAWVVWAPRPPCGDLVMTTSRAFVTTPDDFALVAWCDANIPPERGLIGMAAVVGRAGVRGEEEHLMGLDGMPAFLLRGRGGNYCFTLSSIETSRWVNGYEAYVRDRFDARWCRENKVRYFYATPDGLANNPGLAAAVGDGRLRPLHREGSSCLYEVTEGATP